MGKLISKDKAIELILIEIQKGAKRADILAIAGDEWQIPSRTFDRYYKTALNKHTELRNEVLSKLADESIDIEVTKAKKGILSKIEKQKILSDIAKGIKSSKKDPDYTYGDKIKAIAELNKMDGDYAPNKTEHSGNITTLNITVEPQGEQPEITD